MEKALVIYNSQKINNYFVEGLHELIYELTKMGYDVTVRPTMSEDDISKVMKTIHDVSLLVLAGGDGTIHQAVNGLANESYSPPILFYPIGTVNDYAHSLKLQDNIASGLELVSKKSYITTDIASINDKFFDYIAGFGLFTKVSYSVSKEAKNIFGPLAYVLAGAAEIKNLKKTYHMKLNIDGEKIEGDFMLGLISNGSSVAGIRDLYKCNVLNDGFFDVLLVTNKWDYNPTIIPHVLVNGITDNVNKNKFIYRKAASIEIETDDNVAWTIDGESGPIGSVSINVLPNKLKIYANHKED